MVIVTKCKQNCSPWPIFIIAKHFAAHFRDYLKKKKKSQHGHIKLFTVPLFSEVLNT